MPITNEHAAMIRYCFFLVNLSGITGFRFLSRNTQNATTGRTKTSTVFNTLSLMISARFAPAIEPTNAHATVPGTRNRSTHLLFTRCHVDTAVPVADDNLFVAIALCTGTLRTYRPAMKSGLLLQQSHPQIRQEIPAGIR